MKSLKKDKAKKRFIIMKITTSLSDYIKPTITALLSSIIYYYFQYHIIVPSGLISINENLIIDKKSYTLITIENNKSRPFGPIKIKTEKSISPKNITSNSYVTIEEQLRNLNNSEYKILEIKDIKPLSITRLIIPAENNEKCCVIFDSGGFDVNINGSQIRDSKLFISLISAALQGFILLIFLVILKTYIKGQKEEALEDKKLLKQDLIDLKKQISESKKSNSRNRLFLLKRIFEYKKEIKFLRELISSSSLSSKLDSKKFFKLVSKKLETQTTHSDVSKEFEFFMEHSKKHDDVRDEVEVYLSENNEK